MFKWMRENDECFKRPPVSANMIAPPAAAAPPAIPKEFLEDQKRLNAKLLEEIQKLSASVAALKESSQKASDQTQKRLEGLPKAPELLSQIEAKLQEHAASVTTAAPPKNAEFEAQLLERLTSLGGQVSSLSETVQRPAAPVGLSETDRAYIQELNNDTLNALAQLKSESSVEQKSGECRTHRNWGSIHTHFLIPYYAYSCDGGHGATAAGGGQHPGGRSPAVRGRGHSQQALRLD